jgi:hypothetical protein
MLSCGSIILSFGIMDSPKRINNENEKTVIAAWNEEVAQ